MQAAEPAPPFVMFENRAIEDREASIASGQYVAKDIIYAIITPSGTKDRIEKVADDWLAGLEEAVKQERIPLTWLDAYKRMLAAWKETREVPTLGTPISTWPGASVAQVQTCLNANIRTVEELAQATEEGIDRLGMGGRALKAKAINWLEVAQSTGATSEKITALEVENEALKARNEELENRVKTLETQNQTLIAAKTVAKEKA